MKRNFFVAILLLTSSVCGQDYLYVACGGAGSQDVVVVDVNTNQIVATITNPTSPFYIAANSNLQRAYTTNSNQNTVTVIDSSNNTATATITVGSAPQGIAISPDESTVYVANTTPNTGLAHQKLAAIRTLVR